MRLPERRGWVVLQFLCLFLFLNGLLGELVTNNQLIEMKKYLNWSVLMVLLMTLCVTLVSCGGDDEELFDTPKTSDLDEKIHGGWHRVYSELGALRTETLVFVLHDHSGMRSVVPGHYTQTYGFEWRIEDNKYLYLKNTDVTPKETYKFEIVTLIKEDQMTLKNEAGSVFEFRYM